MLHLGCSGTLSSGPVGILFVLDISPAMSGEIRPQTVARPTQRESSHPKFSYSSPGVVSISLSGSGELGHATSNASLSDRPAKKVQRAHRSSLITDAGAKGARRSLGGVGLFIPVLIPSL